MPPHKAVSCSPPAPSLSSSPTELINLVDHGLGREGLAQVAGLVSAHRRMPFWSPCALAQGPAAPPGLGPGTRVRRAIGPSYATTCCARGVRSAYSTTCWAADLLSPMPRPSASRSSVRVC